jgi:hypothetical protein
MSKLLDQALTLPLGLFSSLISVDCLVHQAWELRFDCVLGLAHTRKHALKKGDLLSCLVSLPASRR